MNQLFLSLIIGLFFLSLENSALSQVQKFEISDSIPLFDDQRVFTYMNSEKFGSDTIIAYSYPNLDVSFIDSKGKFLSKLTQKGGGPGMLGNSGFIDIKTGSNGNTYILRQDNAYALYVYSPLGKYIGRVDLFRYLAEYYSPAYYSSFHVDDLDKETITLTMSVGSTQYPEYSKAFYEKSFGIAQFIIDRKSLEVQEVTNRLAYKEDPYIKKAISNNAINWYQPYPIFKFTNNYFYLTNMYRGSIDIFNRDFIKLKELKINSLPTLKNHFKISFQELQPKDVNARIKRDQKLQFENVNIFHIDVNKKFALVQLVEARELGRHEVKGLRDLQNGATIDYPIILILKDLDSGIESLIKLPNRFQGKAYLLNANQLLITGRPSLDIEEMYLYKLTF